MSSHKLSHSACWCPVRDTDLNILTEIFENCLCLILLQTHKVPFLCLLWIVQLFVFETGETETGAGKCRVFDKSSNLDWKSDQRPRGN